MHISDHVILGPNTLQFIWNLFYKKLCVYPLCSLRNLSFSKDNAEKKLTVPLWWPPGAPMHWIFVARYISRKKTLAIWKSTNWINNPRLVRGDLCESQTPESRPTHIFTNYQSPLLPTCHFSSNLAYSPTEIYSKDVLPA